MDDAVDLAWVFTLELGLIDPDRCILALAGQPVKEESKTRLSALLESGAKIEQPRKREILRLSMEQCQRGEARGIFILSVATHGLSEGGIDFLIAGDSLRDDLLDTGVSVQKLFEKAANAQALRRILLLDACREMVHQGQRSISEPTMSRGFAEAIAEARGLTVLSGSTVGGYSYDDPTTKNGVFSGNLVRGLLGAAPADSRGFITVETLADYVQHQVITWVRKNRPRHVKVSRGIERRFDEEAEKLPLAIDPHRARPEADFETVRKSAILKLRENIGDSEKAIISGELFSEISRYLRSEQKPAAADQLLTVSGEPRRERIFPARRARFLAGNSGDPAGHGQGTRRTARGGIAGHRASHSAAPAAGFGISNPGSEACRLGGGLHPDRILFNTEVAADLPRRKGRREQSRTRWISG